MNNILIIGGNGNLGNQLMKLLPNAVSWGRADADITNLESVQNKFAELQAIDTIINCAAYNDLDAAEDNPEQAFALNAKAPEILAELAKANDCAFVQFSTGYVFSGEDGSTNHDETAAPSPNSVYAQSKLAGEEAVQKVGGKYYIIRTNVLFGPAGQSDAVKPSVVDIMRRIGSEKHHLRGITDEHSNFTYTPDLAAATVNLFQQNPASGIFHLINEGSGSWYDLAKQIFVSLGWNVLDSNTESVAEREIVIEKITGSEYPRKAKRPKNAVLVNTKLPKLRSWQDALNEYLTSE